MTSVINYVWFYLLVDSEFEPTSHLHITQSPVVAAAAAGRKLFPAGPRPGKIKGRWLAVGAAADKTAR